MISLPATRVRAAAILGAAIAAMTGLAPGAATATSVPRPMWEAFPVFGPTHLSATTGERDQVADVLVGNGGESNFALGFEGSTTGELSCSDATSTVQRELEALPSIGAGNVEVSAEEAVVGSCGHYLVTFAGSLADQPLPELTGTPSTTIETSQAGRGGWGKLAVYLINDGGAIASGTITVTVTLPAGITTYETPAGVPPAREEGPGLQDAGWTCSRGAGLHVITCTDEQPAYPGLGPGEPGTGPYANKADDVPIGIPLHVEDAVPGQLSAEVEIEGGGAAPAIVQAPVTISQSPAPPGLATMNARVYEADGSAATNAGAHPFAITTGFFVNTVLNAAGIIKPAGAVKNVEANLPPGLVGNPQAVPKCESHGELQECALHHQESQIGVALTVLEEGGSEAGFGEDGAVSSSIWNLVPEAEVPAEFGFIAGAPSIFLRARVRSESDYGISVLSPDTIETREVVGSILTFWGKPNEPAHDPERCAELSHGRFIGCEESKVADTPFLTDPTDCLAQADAQPLFGMEVSFWQHPEELVPALSTALAPVTGCAQVPFNPTLRVQPTQRTAASPSGVTTELQMPQVESQQGTAEADVQKAVVTLPRGMTISPASAEGLLACSESQIGLTSVKPPSFDTAPPSCPEASKLGTVAIDTPLLPEPLTGYIYLAAQGENPFGTLLAVYLYAIDPAAGIEVKVAGRIEPDPVTGQITATFEELPQLPWGKVTLSFKSGPRAPLVTPPTCGSFEATAVLTPTSIAGVGPLGEAIPGGSDATTTTSFPVEGCRPPAFAPTFVAGTENNAAGSFSPFAMTLRRESDEEANPRTIALTMPPGFSAMLANVPLCGEPEAGQGDCPAATKVGHVTIVAGDGPNPLTLPQPGAPEDPVYLTGPYEGAPFGLTIVVPAKAGPFDLGTVVVRARVQVDPQTAQIRVLSDPMPTILQGIPTDLKVVHVVVDHERFTFNPTSCAPMTVTGQIGADNGATASVSSKFQAADCGALPFHPVFEAFTKAHHTRRDGALLHVVMKSGLGQANLREVRVSLPRAMPSELKTLQHACTEGQFDADPSKCPEESVVGHAVVHTPVLPVPLEGPAYFVSHGGAKYPELVMVLKGYGVTIELNGETEIKGGTTISTFHAVPDVPFTRFDLVLPMRAGDSALGATTNFCKHPQAMPTRLVAQSGKVIERSTKVHVEGCKPAIYVLAHRVHGSRATLSVRVPFAGRLTARGAGIASSARAIAKAGVIALPVNLTAAASRRKGRARPKAVRVRVHLAFHSTHHEKLRKTVALKLRPR